MRRLILPAILLLLVSGCAAAPAEPDEGGYLESIKALYPKSEAISDEDLTEIGNEMCDAARSADVSMAEMADQIASISDAAGRELNAAVAVAATSNLCPDLAE